MKHTKIYSFSSSYSLGELKWNSAYQLPRVPLVAKRLTVEFSLLTQQ